MMMTPERRKQAQIAELSTETLRRICKDNPPASSTRDKPLAGQVSIEGIGPVPTRWLHDELAKRWKE
jgi:hypothetical protein